MIIEGDRLVKVEEIDILNGTCTIPEGITAIGQSAFYGCKNLESVELPDSLNAIGTVAFMGCKNLRRIDIPEGVTTIGNSAFWSCDSLESVRIPGSVNDIGNHAFGNCGMLESVTLSEGVGRIGSLAFNNCYNLKKINIPESVTFIGGGGFNNCKGLERVVLSQSTDVHQSAFDSCNNLRTVMFRDKVPESFVKDGALTDKAVACFGPDVTITVTSSSKKSVEKEKITEKSPEKTEKQTSDRSNSVTSNKKAVVQMKESSIHPLPNYPGRSYASIGLNSEHGTYGYIRFLDKFVKTPRCNPDIRLLYLNPSKEYNVTFSNPDTGSWEYHNMTGREISDGNKAYLRDRGLLKEAVSERPLPSVADNLELPQSDTQYEG